MAPTSDLPGTTLSPFDPTPPDVNDPFSSTGPWAGPQDTWQALTALESGHGRQRAIEVGQRHGQLMDRLVALADANGGGLSGLFSGQLHRLEAAQLLSPRDRERIEAVAGFLRDPTAIRAEEDPQQRLRYLCDEILHDPDAMPIAIAIATVAVDSGARAVQRHDDFTDGYAAAYADVVGIGLGGFGGPLGSIAVATSLSVLAADTHVDVSVTYG